MADKRPKNREVENEMIRPPAHSGEAPRPATEPAKPADPREGSRQRKETAKSPPK